MPSHRVLAVMRGEKEQVLALNLDGGDEEVYHAMVAQDARRRPDRQRRAATPWLATTVKLAWRVKLMISAAVDARIRLKQRAELDAVAVFAKNLKDLLLAAPAGTRTTLGLDPGFRTGVKVAVVDGTGKVRRHLRDLPAPAAEADGTRPRRRWGRWSRGTGSTSSPSATAPPPAKPKPWQAELIADIKASGAAPPVQGDGQRGGRVGVLGVGLRGARAADLDVTLRGAVSIARRLQDPLAELVKIEPKSIGVGQYQHDITPGTLARSLDAVVEDAVNAVGVDLNTASVPLLARVSGVTDSLAEADRRAPRVDRPVPQPQGAAEGSASGPQGIRAMRRASCGSRDGDDPLDASGVHPESYPVVRRILDRSGVTLAELIGDERSLRSLRPADFADDRFGIPDGDRHPRRVGEAGPRSAARRSRRPRSLRAWRRWPT